MNVTRLNDDAFWNTRASTLRNGVGMWRTDRRRGRMTSRVTKKGLVVLAGCLAAGSAPSAAFASSSHGNDTLTAPQLLTHAAQAFLTVPEFVLSGTVTESGATISKVEFFSGTTLLGTATASPYTFSWASVPAGTYSLTAQAFDSGTSGASQSHRVACGRWASEQTDCLHAERCPPYGDSLARTISGTRRCRTSQGCSPAWTHPIDYD